jgi:hypothetical protein
VMQQKTQRPVQFEITEPTRETVGAWIAHARLKSERAACSPAAYTDRGTYPPGSAHVSWTPGSVSCGRTRQASMKPLP